MMTIKFYDNTCYPSLELMELTTDFLYRHLEQYGDPRCDIRKALVYALKKTDVAGGFICLATEEDDIIGAAVINRTGMEDYIPENILVYIAVHQDRRGHGIGKQILTEVIRHTEGSIALHVEPDNPARFWYQGLGFTQKYLEMRLNRKEVS